jgi:hypothetical protein
MWEPQPLTALRASMACTRIALLLPIKNFKYIGKFNFKTNGYRGLFLSWINRPGREADHSPPTSAEVKTTWMYTSTPLYVFMA